MCISMWLILIHQSYPYVELLFCTFISWQPIYQKDGAKDDVKHFNNNHKDQANEDVDAKHFISYDKDQVQDDVKHFANNHKDQAKDHVDHFSNNHTKANKDEIKALDKVVPFAYADDTGDCLSPSAGRLLDFRLSGISITNGDEDSEEETESLASEPRVPVGSYRVRESYAPILRAIFNKYGDIGANVQLESAVMRTYYVECVCFVVQELQSTSIMEFTKSKVKELKAILKDVESAKLQVSWLQSILNEVAEYIELISQHQAVEMAKANSDSEVESLKEELESDLKTLAQREQEVAAIKNRISETRDRLRELELRSCELDKNMSMIKSKVDGLNGKSLIEELL